MYQYSNCCGKPIRTEPVDELDDMEGKTFYYVCSECQKPCDISDGTGE